MYPHSIHFSVANFGQDLFDLGIGRYFVSLNGNTSKSNIIHELATLLIKMVGI